MYELNVGEKGHQIYFFITTTDEMFYFRSLQNTLFKKPLWSSYRHLRLLLRHVTFAEAAPNFVSYHQDARIAGRRYGGVHREPGQEGG